MKYKPQYYAKAFADLAADHPSIEKEKGLIHNLIKSIEKNGDVKQIKKIYREIEKEVGKRTGKRKVTVETARPLKKDPRALLKKFLTPKDVVETKIDPSLVAGIKITINDELELDQSLKRKINKLFS